VQEDLKKKKSRGAEGTRRRIEKIVEGAKEDMRGIQQEEKERS
jgi:hypothetical protein